MACRAAIGMRGTPLLLLSRPHTTVRVAEWEDRAARGVILEVQPFTNLSMQQVVAHVSPLHAVTANFVRER